MSTTRVTQEIAGILRAELSRTMHTQAWFGQIVGISQSQMSKVLRGVKPLDTNQLAVACEIFGREMSDVIREAEVRAGADTDGATRTIHREAK